MDPTHPQRTHHTARQASTVHSCREQLTEDKELCSACFPSLAHSLLLMEEQTLMDPSYLKDITLKQNYYSTQKKKPSQFQSTNFPKYQGHGVAYTSCQSAATCQETVLTQI